ncbi:MAG TPA: NADPH-dependent FMN reductase [Bauldia sp.]|nr:NADPH-dependent FMN reductase [Bauldia sp.]
MLKIAIIVGSTRPNRRAPEVAKWIHDIASRRTDAAFEIVDIGEYDLPVLDEPMPPSMGNYAKEHTRAWSARIASFDGYIFIVPEYNHSISGSLKNAIDFVYHEWTNKAAGFVSYGTTGGVRAVEHLRGVMAEIQIADVRAHVSLSLHTDFVNYREFRPAPGHQGQVDTLLNQLVAWSAAMKGVREDARKAKVAA